jgi:hypothetical protein
MPAAPPAAPPAAQLTAKKLSIKTAKKGKQLPDVVDKVFKTYGDRMLHTVPQASENSSNRRNADVYNLHGGSDALLEGGIHYEAFAGDNDTASEKYPEGYLHTRGLKVPPYAVNAIYKALHALPHLSPLQKELFTAVITVLTGRYRSRARSAKNKNK